jgi:type II secretory pathway pseudopilin PulG
VGQEGFTLVEVLIALLLAMIGLMGAVAVQQTVLSATSTAGDAQVAMRLATQALEELNGRALRRGPPTVDHLAPIVNGGAWSDVVFLDTAGNDGGDTYTPIFRFGRRFQVVNQGFQLPYRISVEVTYRIDAINPDNTQMRRAVRFDIERRKSW